MARKSRNPNFNQLLDLLRAQFFEVAEFPGITGGVLVSKNAVGAVLVAAPAASAGAPALLAVAPGALIAGQLARLVDRGFQKFLKADQIELPASAAQLEAIHRFDEQLKQFTGGLSLFNQSLGTTSDLYLYDRLKGREAAQSDV